jgi:hypothetical protein
MLRKSDESVQSAYPLPFPFGCRRVLLFDDLLAALTSVSHHCGSGVFAQPMHDMQFLISRVPGSLHCVIACSLCLKI